MKKTAEKLLQVDSLVISGTSIGTGATLSVQDDLVALLSYMNVNVMNKPRLTIANVASQVGENGKLELKDRMGYLKKHSDAFVEFVEKNKN